MSLRRRVDKLIHNPKPRSVSLHTKDADPELVARLVTALLDSGEPVDVMDILRNQTEGNND